MARAEASLIINCPVGKVFAYLADISRRTEWQSELLEVHQTSSGPMGIGTTLREVRRLMGQKMETAFTVTEYEPDVSLGFKSTSEPIPNCGVAASPVPFKRVSYFASSRASGFTESRSTSGSRSRLL